MNFVRGFYLLCEVSCGGLNAASLSATSCEVDACEAAPRFLELLGPSTAEGSLSCWSAPQLTQMLHSCRIALPQLEHANRNWLWQFEQKFQLS